MRNEFNRFIRSFGYAFRGIAYAVKHERNMRFHLCAAVTVAAFSLFYDLSKAEICTMLLCMGAVISAEMINTAVERTADIGSEGRRNALAGAAKDCAAGAVLVSALFSAICGVVLFYDKEVIKRIIMYYSDHPVSLAGLVLWVIFSVFFCLKRKDK